MAHYDDQITWRVVLALPAFFNLIRLIGLTCFFREEILSAMILEHHIDELEHYFKIVYAEK